MGSFISFLLLLFIAACGTARPFSGIESYGGDTRQRLRVNEDGAVLARAHYPSWLDDGHGPPPWKLSTAHNDGTLTIPETGTTRRYNFTITRARLAPDGVSRDMFAINGQFPGPLLEANWGDMIEITVNNNITGPEEPTALHWHGLLQRDSPWADGALGVSQCPIAPGSSFTYRFRADSYGTSFYHAHYSAQYTAGVVGPMQIYGPAQQDYDIDLGPIMLTDWYHAPYPEIVRNVLGTDFSKLRPISDSGLINGRGRFDCSLLAPGTPCEADSEYATFRFQSSKTHRLRLINHGADGIQKFSIDDHVMTVIAVDFTPVRPYNTNIVTLGVGQRADVLVQGRDDATGSFWMRSQMPGGIFCGGNNNTQAIRAAVVYESADVVAEPSSQSTNNDASCVNAPLDTIEPEYPVAIASDPIQLDLTMTLAINDTGSFVWMINDQTFHADLSKPLLFDKNLPALANGNMYNTGDARSVRLNVTNATPFQHPFHLHGYHFQVLASGPDTATSQFPATDANPIFPLPATTWNGTIEVSTANPAQRDTHIVPALGYSVFQFDTINPGVWSFHCHTAWHQSAGMSVNLLIRPDAMLKAPEGMGESTCDAWSEWATATSFGPIDAAG